MFGKKKNDDIFEDTNDLLIVFDDDKKTSDIQRITRFQDNAIIVNGRYNIPLSDCEVTNSIEGRHFFYRAPSESVKETRRLAELEKSMILSQITNYKKEDPEAQGDMTKLLLIIAIMIAFIMFGFSSCQGVGV